MRGCLSVVPIHVAVMRDLKRASMVKSRALVLPFLHACSGCAAAPPHRGLGCSFGLYLLLDVEELCKNIAT